MAGQATVLGATLLGIDGVAVEVEVRISSQLPRVDIVGLPEAAVRESAARVRAAIRAIGFTFPADRITINLAPAALRKQGAGLDLAIATGILVAAGFVPADAVARIGFVGELALDGRIRGVRGTLALTHCLRRHGCQRVITPAAQTDEASLLGNEAPEVAETLGEIVRTLLTEGALPRAQRAADDVATTAATAPDLGEVCGQEGAKRALVVAAAGGHGVLFRGAPGAGKTLLARCLPGILPPLSRSEALEVARIHDAAGLPFVGAAAARERPFRAPHHSASRAGLLGGGRQLGPGEATLAHRGVLFLDELPEFDRASLESLRQVLEDRRIVHARAEQRIELPADVQLVATANPCPCGYYQSGTRDCRCDDGALERYDRRLSGPLLDRIDLHVPVQPVPFAELDRGVTGSESESLRQLVAEARRRQAGRREALGLPPSARHNASLPPSLLHEAVRATDEARRLLARAADQLALSARAAHRLLRVARTIADLEGEEQVGPAAMAEAVSYRSAAR